MKNFRITIGNKSYDVTVEDLTEAESYQGSPAYPTAPAPAPTPAATPQAASPPAAAATPRPQLPIDVGAVTSPMAGVIKSVLVKPADEVKQGQPLIILEAMKMENQITAPVAGRIKQVDVQEGDSVQEGHVLLVVE